MSTSPPGVLFIGGWGRSGSTLLALMLGQVPSFVAVGEVREVWRRGLEEDGLCGCGQPFRRCAFWSDVGARAFGGWDRAPLERILSARYSVDRGWMTPALAPTRRSLVREDATRWYVSVLGRLYGAIADVSGASWIVDSSKLPSHALLLHRIQGMDLRLLHLLRDSRGVACSWQKQVSADGVGRRGRYMARYGPVSASLRYTAYNAATTALRRRVPYLRLRYEDLVESPEMRLRSVLSFVGEPPDQPLPFPEPDAMEVLPTHTADGNPARFAQGAMRIRVDDSWQSQLKPSHRRIVTMLTAPSLAAYGYPLRLPAG